MFLTIVIGTILTVGACVMFQLLSPSALSRSPMWIGIGIVSNFLFNSFLVYALTPPMLGPLGGYQWVWPTLLINFVFAAICAAANSEQGNSDESEYLLNSTRVNFFISQS